MSDLLLVDTNILVDYSRGRADAVEYLEGLSVSPMISAITVAELYGGIREGSERAGLNELIERLTVIQVTAETAEAGGLYRRDYFKSHGVGLMDAIKCRNGGQRGCDARHFEPKAFPDARKYCRTVLEVLGFKWQVC